MVSLSKLKWIVRRLLDGLKFRLKCLRLWVKSIVLHPGQLSAYRRHRKEHPPIFVVGCGHSGTSLLLAVLGAHSHICPIPEETELAYNYITSKVGLKPEAPGLIRYFDLLTVSEGKLRWVEKTPKHIFSIPLLRETFPGCKFILILRDGRDVAASIEARYGSIRDGIQRWVDDNKAGEPFWNDADVHVLKYENLVEDLRGTMEKALQFLGEPFEESVLHSHEKPKYFYSKKIEKAPDTTNVHHHQHRNWQINQKVFDGRGKWKSLDDEKKQVIKEIGGSKLIEYGYTASQDW